MGWIVALLAVMPVAGQSCSQLPTDQNRLWVGARVVAGAETTRGSAKIGFDLLGHVYLSGGVHWGGFDTGSDPAAGWEFGVGAPLAAGPFDLCPTLFTTWTRFAFEERFGADRGEVRDFRSGLRLPVGGALARGESRDLRWLASVDVAYRHWHFVGRRIVIDESVTLVRDQRVEESAVVEGLAALKFRSGTVGLTAGLASRLLDRRRILPFVQLSLRVG